MVEERSEKKQFIDKVMPTWISQAKERQSQWSQYKPVDPDKLIDASNIEKVRAEASN